jgi:deferrochelatase/peroxidase EfeB
MKGAVSRRGFLGTASAAVAGVTLAGCGDKVETSRSKRGRRDPATLDFYGPHQPGIATPAQQHLQLAAFDLQRDDADALRELLIAWSAAAASLMAGQPRGGDGHARDTG